MDDFGKKIEDKEPAKAKEDTESKFARLFTKEHLKNLGFNEKGEELPLYLTELEEPILESNLNFLLEYKNAVEEWEKRFIALKSETPQRIVIDCKILLKEILDRSKGMDSPVSMIERYGGATENAELSELNKRLAFLKTKIMDLRIRSTER